MDVSRKIRFRAWGKSSGKWLTSQDRFPLSEFDSLGILRLSDNSEDTVWEQFTGLRDKAGKEIYEGDVVGPGLLRGTAVILAALRYPGAYWLQEQGEDCEEYGSGDYTMLLGYADTADFEVIGNIHSNPELLKP